MKFRKRPIEVDAILPWEGTSPNADMLDYFCKIEWSFAGSVEVDQCDEAGVVVYNTAEKQWIGVHIGHWIIRGIHGELYPCDPVIFEKTYEQIEHR